MDHDSYSFGHYRLCGLIEEPERHNRPPGLLRVVVRQPPCLAEAGEAPPFPCGPERIVVQVIGSAILNPEPHQNLVP